MAPKKSIGETYQKKTQLEHILDIPDTYIGSVEEDKYEIYVYDEATNRMIFKNINFIPGLFKIYDEIIVNAFDQYVRLNDDTDKNTLKVKKIDVTLNKETGEISVLNDGNGIDVVMHPDHNVYIPSMIFGELLTSTNYNKDDKKITGGKNGYGAKLTNIYSTQFYIETVDHTRSLKFSQTFYDNMGRFDPPKVVKANKTGPYTLIKFKPDYKRFKCETGLTDDMYDVMVKRVYDLSACTSSNVIVSLNGKKIEYKNFEEYVDLYIGPKTDTPRIYEKLNDRWEIAIAMNDNFEQISFVNGINTIKGGKHVEYVLNQIIKGVIDEIEKKKKIKVKPNVIKDMLIIFVKSTIENPSFDSQTKETLNTTSSKFGSKCEVSDVMIKNLCKMGIIDRAISISEIKDNKDLKKTDGKKTSNIRGIPKLDDANDAGGKNSASCTLILTEGDSAKSMAIAGLSVVGRDKYGVFPLRGKILNVQDISVQKIADNEEISNLKKIIGLESGKNYEDLNKLRYGKIMIMTDQDSVVGDTPLLLKNKNGLIEFKTIEDLVKPDDFKSIINDDSISVKEYGDVEYEVWTEKGWTKIKHVMRHMVEKDIYRVLTHTGIVDVTEDHSLLNKDGQKITPKECVIGGELLHSFPLFEENNSYKITAKDSYNQGLLYSKNSNEFISNEILNSNKTIIEAFLKGYFENNDNDNDNDIDVDNDNESFVLNIKGKIKSQSIYYLCKSLGYEVSINNNDDNLLLYTLNITKGTQQDNLNRIKKIFNLGKTKQYVYDLETDNHHFQAGVGQLICHNTDGHHIKGLLFNIFKNMWPSLLNIDGFMSAMLTPIVKVTKGSQKIAFITLQEFEAWRQANNGGKGWDVKYYKGLGTSTTSEAKEYFENMNVITYECNETTSFDALDLAFNKTRADDRKAWLSNYNRDKILDISTKKVNYEDFINNELIHFSNNDLERSIPSMCDGLKVSTRKILYCCFKRKLYYNKKEIRVAQLAGYVSEHSAYHHGEASLQGAIIGMAQNFVCSNNINLLMPNGQYGSRLQNGSDSASPRYIHTLLNKLTTIIYKEEDNAILKYLDDDGYKIEPEHYMPILPMILVNGAIGIGTGYSTNIPCYNPLEIVSNLKLLLLDESAELNQLKPWYMGFKGQILDLVNNSYITKGNYRIIDNNTVEITELPIGLAIEDYKQFLEDMIIDNDKDKEKEKDNKDKKKKTIIKKRYLVSYENHCSESNIKFILNLDRGTMKELDKQSGCGYTLFEKEFKLISSKMTNINNMHLYDKRGVIKKFNNVQEIIKDFYDIRLEFYVKRKEYILKRLERELKILASKVRFINDVVEERLKIGKKKKEELKEYLEKNKYPKICDKKKASSNDNDEGAEDDNGADIFNDDEEGTYDYLLRMPVYTLTIDNREDLLKQKINKENEIDELKKKTVKTIWETELNEFIVEYTKYYNHHMEELSKNSEIKQNKKKQVKAQVSGSKKK